MNVQSAIDDYRRIVSEQDTQLLLVALINREKKQTALLEQLMEKVDALTSRG